MDSRIFERGMYMKKKPILTIMMFVLLFTFALPISAMGVQSDLMRAMRTDGQIVRSNGSFFVMANTSFDAVKTEVNGVLYEDGWLWDTQVSSCANSSSGSACTATGYYAFQNNKKYRLDYSATFYYADGTSETLTGSSTG